MARIAPLAVRPDAAVNELSYDSSESLLLYVLMFHDGDQTGCKDPFDILAEIEEEQGFPINQQ